MGFLNNLEEGVGKIVNAYEDRKEVKGYYGRIDDKEMKERVEKKGYKVDYIVSFGNYRIIKFKDEKQLIIYFHIGKIYKNIFSLEGFLKSWNQNSDKQAIKEIISGPLGYKGFQLSEAYCLKNPKSCILFPMFHWKMGIYNIGIVFRKIEDNKRYSLETLTRALSTKGIKPIDLLILKKRNLVSEDLSNLILYRDKNNLEKQYGKEVNNNILTNLSWYEILKAYTDPEVINASYIIGRERENSNWLGLTEKEIDFYANGGKYEVNIYVKVKKGGKIYEEKIKKGGYKEVKDLGDGVVLLEKKEKVELEKPIITKQQAQELKKLLLEGKKELSEKKEWLKISKAKIEKFKDGLKFA